MRYLYLSHILSSVSFSSVLVSSFVSVSAFSSCCAVVSSPATSPVLVVSCSCCVVVSSPATSSLSCDVDVCVCSTTVTTLLVTRADTLLYSSTALTA